MAQIDGKELKVGDYVNFKCDIEQGGVIKKIEGTRLTLESANGFYGDYIGGDTTTVQSARDCWL
jgi:hypothetical protein